MAYYSLALVWCITADLTNFAPRIISYGYLGMTEHKKETEMRAAEHCKSIAASYGEFHSPPYFNDLSEEENELIARFWIGSSSIRWIHLFMDRLAVGCKEQLNEVNPRYKRFMEKCRGRTKQRDGQTRSN